MYLLKIPLFILFWKTYFFKCKLLLKICFWFCFFVRWKWAKIAFEFGQRRTIAFGQMRTIASDGKAYYQKNFRQENIKFQRVFTFFYLKFFDELTKNLVQTDSKFIESREKKNSFVSLIKKRPSRLSLYFGRLSRYLFSFSQAFFSVFLKILAKSSLVGYFITCTIVKQYGVCDI